MSTASRYIAMQLLREEKRLGYPMRIHRSTTHQQRHGRPERKIVRNILPKIETQQSKEVTRIRFPRPRYPTSHHTQQQPLSS